LLALSTVFGFATEVASSDLSVKIFALLLNNKTKIKTLLPGERGVFAKNNTALSFKLFQITYRKKIFVFGDII
jgi:hypothetical protein